MNKFNLLSLILAFFFFSTASAADFVIEVSQSESISLNDGSWISASGALYPGTTPINVYSHKSKQELQVFFEDLYIPKALLKSRLPKACSNLTESSPSACKSESAEGKNFSVSYTSVFPLKQKNLVRVRTVFLFGKKQDTAAIVPKQRAPAGKVVK